MSGRHRTVVAALILLAVLAGTLLVGFATRACPVETEAQPCPDATRNVVVVIALAARSLPPEQQRKAVLIGTLGPYLVKAPDNPEGVDAKVFEDIKAAIRKDRPAFLMEFLRNFYNYDVTGGKLVSERVLEDTPAVRGMIDKIAYLVQVL